MESFTLGLMRGDGAPLYRQLYRHIVEAVSYTHLVTINGFGSTVVAAYTAASKVEQLTTQPTFTFGLAAATFTAQNAGAGKLDRVKDGVRDVYKRQGWLCPRPRPPRYFPQSPSWA